MTNPTWSNNPTVELKARALSGDEKAKFLDIPYYLHLWTGSAKGKRVLDFGCGSGLSSAGVAILHDADLVVGVDINSEAEHCRSFISEKLDVPFPPNLHFEEIAPGQTTSFNDFDVVFSWSVFEHVNNRLYQKVLSQLLAKMRSGALFFVQIAPLYFSPEGSHLWAIGYREWEHLLNQTSDVHDDIMQSNKLSSDEKIALWSMFRTLNRVTAEDLISRFEQNGFALLKQQRDEVSQTPPDTLISAYQLSALKTHQIAAVFQKQ